MIRLKNTLAALFISPEFLILTSCIAGFYYFEPTFGYIGESMRRDAEVWKYLPALPIAFSTAAIGFSSKIRAPLENFSNKTLYEWDLYHLLVDRIYISFFYAIFATGTAISLWFFGQSLDASIIGISYTFAVLSSGATALTMLMAQQKLRELVEKYQ